MRGVIVVAEATQPIAMRRAWLVVAGVVCAAALVVRAQSGAVLPGDPLPGITPAEFEEFRLGLDDFLEVETTDEGLGPAFNGTSCAACHNVPAIGGVSPVVGSAGRAPPRGRAVPAGLRATARRSSICSRSPRTGVSRSCHPRPTSSRGASRFRCSAPGWSRRSTTQTILALEDPSDRNRDGDQRPRGDRHRRRDRRAARRPLRLEGAARDAAGVRRRRLPQRDGHHQRSLPDRAGRRRGRGADAAVRSHSRSGGHPRSAHAAARHRQLRQLHALPGAGGARGRRRAVAGEGERVFGAVGCATCHVPALTTGPSANPLFNRRPVPLFSDLLLHDVGTGDGIQQEQRPRPTRFGRRRCGVCASAARCCTTDPRRRSRTRFAVTAARRGWRARASTG